jgi:hypothetical protein
VARFYFQITHGTEDAPEATLDLPGPKEAWAQATMTAGEMLRDLGAKFRPGTELRIRVADGSRRPIFSVRIVAEAHE